jgi:hypothetical protein
MALTHMPSVSVPRYKPRSMNMKHILLHVAQWQSLSVAYLSRTLQWLGMSESCLHELLNLFRFKTGQKLRNLVCNLN